MLVTLVGRDILRGRTLTERIEGSGLRPPYRRLYATRYRLCPRGSQR